MQETRNNCFVSKKRRTTLQQAKIGNRECRNITDMYQTNTAAGFQFNKNGFKKFQLFFLVFLIS